jgi:hypothetical protein
MVPMEPGEQQVEYTLVTLAVRVGDEKIQVPAGLLTPAVGATGSHLCDGLLTANCFKSHLSLLKV